MFSGSDDDLDALELHDTDRIERERDDILGDLEEGDHSQSPGTTTDLLVTINTWNRAGPIQLQ